MLVIIKFDNESYFKDYDEKEKVSPYIWTGIKKEAMIFNTNDIYPFDLDPEEEIHIDNILEDLIDEGFLPLTLEKYED